MNKFIKFLIIEKIFFFQRFNFLFIIFCILLYTFELLLNVWDVPNDEISEVNTFLIQNHLGKISLAFAILFLYGLSKDFKSKKIQNFIANGFKNQEIYFLKLAHAFIISGVTLMTYFFTDIILSYIKVGNIYFHFSFFAVLLYLLSPLFLCSLLLFFFCITKNSLFTIILLVTLAASEQALKKFLFNGGNSFLPISSFYNVLQNVTLNYWFLFYLLLFNLLSFLYLKSVKNWDAF